MIADITCYNAQFTDNAAAMSELLDQHGTTLRNIPGVGPVLAARIVGRTGGTSRFPTAAAFANYAGVVPVEIASGDSTRHRLSRYGDRELNSALRTIAMVQIRMRGGVGRVHNDKKITDGKTPKGAERCRERRLADLCWRTMIPRARPGHGSHRPEAVRGVGRNHRGLPQSGRPVAGGFRGCGGPFGQQPVFGRAVVVRG
ncbi:IS110 family transposase [Nocardia gamkensis]|uniref:IS110 family transposase n=1 Tax=Nocardia gamkensis TaxID=352869 RepID=UPI0037CAAE30